MKVGRGLGVSTLIGALLAMSGCTKEVPFKEVPKDEQLTNKNVIDTESKFLYMASNGESSRSSPVSRPYWMGQEKLVKFQFTESSLQVVELERESRFKDNKTNNKLVLEIPISHLAFQCQKDRFGECTGQEEENSAASWKDRGFFKPTIQSMKVAELSVLPVELQNFFGDNCYKEVGSRLVDYELSRDNVNIRLEKTFAVTAQCLSDSIETLSDLTFSSIYDYSIVKLSQLSSPGYKPVAYPRQDENTFGFFTTVVRELDVDNLDTKDKEITLMNRWNPERGAITYLLSEAFAKESNKAVREATVLAVDRVNQALATSGSKISILLKDAKGESPGDLRNNMIIMVEDPIATNIIGYGPSVPNPETGEILAGKTVMYLGTIKKFIRSTYNELVEKIRAEAAEAAVAKPSVLAAETQIDASKINSQSASLVKALLSQGKAKAKLQVKNNLSKGSGKLSLSTKEITKVATDTRSYHKHAASHERLKDRIEAMSEHCAYPAELMNFEQAITDALKEIVGLDPKPWDQLAEADKTKILALVVPFVWIPTLVHELGHNLGLRHNFAGSEDKNNYYSLEELKPFGVEREITYSSVMDYPYSNLNELPAMGKYDIAALRFGYAREVRIEETRVKTEDGKEIVEIIDRGVLPVKTNLKDLAIEVREIAAKEGSQLAIRDYAYCTDENVSVNPGCKRFDEGSTFTETAQHFVRAYEKDYKRRNFRNGMRNFSIMSDVNAASRIDDTFRNLRLYFETYERLNTQFNITPEQWEGIPFLKDIRTATDIAATFLTGVIKTPDVTCAYSPSSNPAQIAGVFPLKSVQPGAISCFDAELAERLKGFGIDVVAEGGKTFTSMKDPNSDNSYADQIDVRGIWIDKLIASKYLLTRVLGTSTFDGTQHNFTHYDRYIPITLDTLSQVLMDDVTSPVVFSDANGPLFQVNLRHSLGDTHGMPRPSSRELARFLGVRDEDSKYDEGLLSILGTEVPSRLEHENSSSMLDIFQVRTTLPNSGSMNLEYESITIGTKMYFALPENGMAILSIRAIQAGRDLNELGKEKAKAVLAAIEAGKPPPAEATDLEKRVYQMDPEVIDSFLNDQLKPEAYYSRLLSLLSVLI
jgi:hypothetical protein